jgi:hypothetical protein
MSDLYYDSCQLLLPLNGANNGALFPDYSPAQKYPTVLGNAKTVTAVYKYYDSSAYFDGSIDGVSFPSETGLVFGSGEFTVECWFRRSAGGTYRPLVAKNNTGNNTRSWSLMVFSDDTIQALLSTAGTSSDYNLSSGITATVDQWFHVAMCRVGNVFSLYVDGVLKDSFTAAITLKVETNPVYVGRDAGSNYYTGYIQDVRIHNKGIYTTDFTPPGALKGYSIAGTVLDDAGDPVAKKVYALPRLGPRVYGEATSSASDGSYTISNLLDTPHFVVCPDATVNALILDRVTPA